MLALVLAGCGSAPYGSSYSQHREWKVAGDEDATPGQIIGQGLPHAIAVSGPEDHRVTAVTWSVSSDDDEGPQQGAWRLYDASGAAIADGKLGIVREQGAGADLRALPDGFLLVNYTKPALVHLSLDGTATPVTGKVTRATTRRGDVPLDAGFVEDPGARFYRPADGSVHRLGRLPSRQAQSVQMDPTGTVTVLLPWAATPRTVDWASSATGAAPWTRSSLRLAAGEAPLLEMVAVGDRMLLPLGTFKGDKAQVTAIAVRPGPGEKWQRVPVHSDDPVETYAGVHLDALPDGRLLLGTDTGGMLVQDGSGRFVPLHLPADPEDTSVQVVDGRLWAVDYVHHVLWTSPADPAADPPADPGADPDWTRFRR